MNKACPYENLEPTGIKCPTCQKGELNPSRGRFGPIYKCTEKGCSFYLTSRPTGQKCTYLRKGKKCHALMVEGTKTIPDRCSDRTCPNRNPHKIKG